MTSFRYHRIHKNGELEAEKEPALTPFAELSQEQRERSQKTVFAACVFAIVVGAVILLLTVLDRGRHPNDVWNTRQTLMPQSRSNGRFTLLLESDRDLMTDKPPSTYRACHIQ